MRKKLAPFWEAAGMVPAGSKNEINLEVLLSSSNPRSELFLPFLICHAPVDELLALAAKGYRQKIKDAIHVLFYLLEWGPADPVYGQAIAKMIHMLESQGGGKEHLHQLARSLDLLNNNNSCHLIPYPNRYLKLAALLGSGDQDRYPGQNAIPRGWE